MCGGKRPLAASCRRERVAGIPHCRPRRRSDRPPRAGARLSFPGLLWDPGEARTPSSRIRVRVEART